MSPALDYTGIADLYDALVRFDEDLPFFVETCRGVEGEVLELMAGTGRVSVALAEAGVRLTCVDSSEAMLAVLRAKLAARGLVAEVLHRDVERLDFPARFAAAILPFQSFGELVTEGAQRAALRGVCNALTARGRFVCTMHNPPVRLATVGGGMRTFVRNPLPQGGGEVVLSADQHHDSDERQVHGVQVIEVFDASGAKVREVRTPIRFSLLEAGEFRDLASSEGFEVETMYGDYERAPFDPETSPFMICVLRKLGSRGGQGR